MDRRRFLPTYHYENRSGVYASCEDSAGRPLRDYKIYGAEGGVGDFDEETVKYKVPVRVSGKNILNPESLIVSNNGLYGYVKITDIDEYLTISLILKDPAIELVSGSSLMFTYRGYDARFEDGGAVTYSSHILSNTNILGDSASNYKNGIYLKYLSFYPNTTGNIEAIKAKYDIQIEYGTVKTDYEPYIGSKTYDILSDSPIGAGEYISYLENKDVLPPIQTFKGVANVISVGTSVQPSNIEVQYYKK